MRKEFKPVDKADFCARLDGLGLHGVLVNSMGASLRSPPKIFAPLLLPPLCSFPRNMHPRRAFLTMVLATSAGLLVSAIAKAQKLTRDTTSIGATKMNAVLREVAQEATLKGRAAANALPSSRLWLTAGCMIAWPEQLQLHQMKSSIKDVAAMAKFVQTIVGSTTAQIELVSLVRWLLEDCPGADLEPRLSSGLCKCFCEAHHADEAHTVSGEKLSMLTSGKGRHKEQRIADLLNFLIIFQPHLSALFSAAARPDRHARDASARPKPPGSSPLVTSQELAHAVRAALEGARDSKVRTLAQVESNVAARFGASTFADLGQVTMHAPASPAPSFRTGNTCPVEFCAAGDDSSVFP
jgi:hypothetical protein